MLRIPVHGISPGYSALCRSRLLFVEQVLGLLLVSSQLGQQNAE
jgi:hypothetical protein